MNPPTEPVVTLGIQLAIAAGLMLAMTVIHSVGLVGISRLLRLEKDRLVQHRFDLGAIGLLGTFGMLLFALHLVEILFFALVYLAVGAMTTLEEALFYSASAYATLGWTADYFPAEWRLVGVTEALLGFILIGWSTAFMVTAMRRLAD